MGKQGNIVAMNEYLDKLRTIGTLSDTRTAKTEKWVHDGDRSGSYQTEHWDGRQDVTIKAGGLKVDRLGRNL